MASSRPIRAPRSSKQRPVPSWGRHSHINPGQIRHSVCRGATTACRSKSLMCTVYLAVEVKENLERPRSARSLCTGRPRAVTQGWIGRGNAEHARAPTPVLFGHGVPQHGSPRCILTDMPPPMPLSRSMAPASSMRAMFVHTGKGSGGPQHSGAAAAPSMRWWVDPHIYDLLHAHRQPPGLGSRTTGLET